MKIPDIKWHIVRRVRIIYFRIRFFLFPWQDISGIKIRVDFRWSLPLLMSMARKDYESGEIHILKNTIKNGDVVLELGAGIGLTSAYCANLVGSGNVTTIEANEQLESRIRKLFARNGVNPDLILGVAGTDTGDVVFYRESADIWSSSVLRVSSRSRPVRMKQIDCNKLIDQLKPTYLVIDIEGGEFDLLPRLNLTTIKKLQIEIHEKLEGKRKTVELEQFLFKEGFIKDETLSSTEQCFFSRDTTGRRADVIS